jgi:uncharacterized protein YacL
VNYKLELTGSASPESPSTDHPASGLSADRVNPFGQSRRTYLIVIILLGLAIGALPGLVSFELQVHVFNDFISQNPASVQDVILAMDFLIFLVSPCLFFAIFYLYGRRTARWFKENHLEVILSLFIGSVLGCWVYYLVIAFLVGWGIPFIWQIVFDTIDRGFWGVFVGFTAMALSHMRVGDKPTAPDRSPVV